MIQPERIVATLAVTDQLDGNARALLPSILNDLCRTFNHALAERDIPVELEAEIESLPSSPRIRWFMTATGERLFQAIMDQNPHIS